MTKAKQAAFNLIMAAVMKDRDFHWMPQEWQVTQMYPHPFDKNPVLVNFVGHLYSGAYSPLLAEALAPSRGLVNSDSELILWFAQIPEDPRQHFIWAEIRNGSDAYLCCTGTDHSGAGGKGLKRVRAVFEFLADVFDLQIEEREVSHELHEAALAMVNQLREGEDG